jgi:Tol biopolymer transport system component
MRGTRIGRWTAAGAAMFAGGLAVVGTASGKGGGGGGGGGTPISTIGVVAFGDGTNSANRGTYAMSPNGSGLHQLTTQIYPTDVSRGVGPVTVLVNGTAGQDIWAMHADGSGTPVLLRSGSFQSPRFSLAGDRIAYVALTTAPTKSIFVADVVRDGGGDVASIENAVAVYTTSNVVAGIDFSRDGSKIVFSTAGDLWTVRLSDGQVAQITSTSTVEEYPRWSANDDRIAYQRRATTGTAIADVVTRDMTSGATTVVVSGGNSFFAFGTSTGPCWSPDSTNLLFVGYGNNKPVDLYQVGSTGGAATNVTTGTSVQPNTPCWGW